MCDFDDFEPDYLEEDEGFCEDCFDESDDSESCLDQEEADTKKDFFDFDHFWLGIAAGFGYEMGQEERKKKRKK